MHVETDRALRLLFVELCPDNESMDNVVLKTSALNDLYAANTFNTYATAEHIHKLGIDDRLHAGDLGLVEEIAHTIPTRSHLTTAAIISQASTLSTIAHRRNASLLQTHR